MFQLRSSFYASTPQKLDPHSVGLLGAPLSSDLDADSRSGDEKVAWQRSRQDRVEVEVHSNGRALRVVSELFYCGRQATVNGSPARIVKVDGPLRGIVVPKGDSRVSLHYLPPTFVVGLVTTAVAFPAGCFIGFRCRETGGSG